MHDKYNNYVFHCLSSSLYCGNKYIPVKFSNISNNLTYIFINDFPVITHTKGAKNNIGINAYTNINIPIKK